jgi:dTDP-4-amino-4,6-dideoxygalactose transaminase
MPALAPLLHDIVQSGNYVNGSQVALLEDELRSYTGAKFAVGVASGTSALTLSLQALGLSTGDEVIVPAFTFCASASSVVLAGATPVFVDIEPDSFCLNADRLEDALTPRTKAIMPVHLFSQMADMEEFLGFARAHGLKVIEDSAEAIGMRYDDVHAGLLGDVGVLSFFPSKTLGAFGDAGMVITNNAAIANFVRMARYHGRATPGAIAGASSTTAHVVGTNSRMDEVQAAALRVRLRTLDDEIAQRSRLAERYNARLGRLAPNVTVPCITRREHGTPVYYVYTIRAARRDELIRELTMQGIETDQYYPAPLPDQPCFLGRTRQHFSAAENACKQTLALPLYAGMSIDEVDVVCRAIDSFYANQEVARR